MALLGSSATHTHMYVQLNERSDKNKILKLYKANPSSNQRKAPQTG